MITAEGVFGELEQIEWATSQFKNLWASISNKLSSIKALGTVFTSHRDRYEILSVRVKTEDQRIKVEQGLARTEGRISLWKTVNDKIAKYLPEWLSASGTPGLSGLGVVPIVIGVVAIGALSYVAVTGLRLLKDAHTEGQILADLEKGILTAKEAAELIPKRAPLISLGGLGFLPLLIIGGLGFWYFIGAKK